MHTSEQVWVLTLLSWVLVVELWHFGQLTWFWCGSCNSVCVRACISVCVAGVLRCWDHHVPTTPPPPSLCLRRSHYVSLKHRLSPQLSSAAALQMYPFLACLKGDDNSLCRDCVRAYTPSYYASKQTKVVGPTHGLGMLYTEMNFIPLRPRYTWEIQWCISFLWAASIQLNFIWIDYCANIPKSKSNDCGRY